MKFYNRDKEIQSLYQRLNSKNFEFIYLLGKRRIGKTQLIKYLNINVLDTDFFYIFVEKNNLQNLLKKLEKYIYERTNIKYSFEAIEDFLEVFFNQNDIKILVIDEFQNFNQVDKSIFSSFQKKIDEYQDNSDHKIIVLGSIQSMMVKIFENSKEPLYKRATFNIFLQEFNIYTQVDILKDIFGDSYNHNIFLDIYSIFGGIPYYLKSIHRENYSSYNLKKLLKDLFFDDFALLKNEGTDILIEEFGGKYKRYFTILEAIARGKNKRNEIMDEIGLGTGEIDVYLKDLSEVYSLIKVDYPVLEKKRNITRYKINDNFLSFWFRYIYSKKDKFELGLYDFVLQETIEDFENYKGFQFESLVKEFLIEKNKKAELDFVFTKIGTWMDRKNNEVDIVYTDEKENIVFLECKINEKRINKSQKSKLQQGVKAFLDKHPYYKEKNIKTGFAIFDELQLVRFKMN